MNSEFPNVKDLADEAEFQLVCVPENPQWPAALARAIARDTQDKGRDTKVLVHLICFLDDTGFSAIDLAIDQFKATSAEYATQNPSAKIVSRASREVRP